MTVQNHCGACFLIVLLTISGVVSADEETAQQGFELGPLRPSPALCVYVVADDQGADCRLTARRGKRHEGDRLMLRAFDPDEKLTWWEYLEPGQMKDTLYPGSGEIWGIPIAIPDTIIKDGDLFADTDISLRGPGVHQVRVSAGTSNTTISLRFAQPVRYGVSFQNGWWYPWDATLKKAYLYIPKRAEELTIRGQGVKLLDEKGQLVYPAAEGGEQKTVKLPLTATDVVWTMEFDDPGSWKFSAAGFPVILCPDEATARELKASLITLPDGTVVCHQFQKRIAELLPSLLTPDKVGDTAELLALWDKPDPSWFEEPVRNVKLLSPYGLFSPAFAALREQNLDPTSHWSGAIGFKAWQEKEKLPFPENRWDRLMSVPGLWGGASPGINYAEALAQAADLDVPLNPWRGRMELRYRAAASALRDLMVVGEDEVFRGVGADLDSYPGMMPFMVAKKQFPEYGMVAKYMPPEVRKVWTDGLRHVVDRHLPDGMVSCMNQSSHWLVGYESFAEGSGDPRYTTLARRFAERFARSASPAGYFIENCGPDATYCGMQHYHMALYYRMSGDKVLLEGIRKSYNFFNHTVGPEPDGRAFGAFNFAHRTPNGFDSEQYGGAKGILDDVLPEVGIWAKPPTDTEREKQLASLQENLKRPLQDPRGLDLTTPRFEYWTDKPDHSKPFPAEEPRPFIRNLGDELIAVKRPAYYTAIYVGHPVQANYYIRGREVFRQPLPDRAEDASGDPWSYYSTIHAVNPLLGGGMSLFWTPRYGNAVFAGNCTPLAHQGLVAIDTDGVRWWEDYFATRFELDQKAGTLTVTGKLEGQPIRYTRHYRFLNDRLEITLTLEADQPRVELRDLIENVPLLAGPAKANGMTITVDNEEPVTDTQDVPEGKTILKSTANSQTITVADDAGNGVRLELDKARALRLCRSGMLVRNQTRFDRVEIVLPSTITAEAPIVLTYTLLPR